jgi:hypothetical protein
MDLAQLWRQRRWRKLLNIIDHLPRDSAYVEALTDDEELAERMLARPEQPAVKSLRRMSEFSAEVEVLSVIADRIAEQTQVIAATKGAKPHKVKPMPRPRTAMEKVRKRRRETAHRSLVSRLLPTGA